MYVRKHKQYMITTKIIFDRRKAAKKKQPGAIEIRIIENRKTY